MNLTLFKLKKRIQRDKSGMGSLVGVILGGVVLSTIVASGTSWYISMRNNLGNTEDKLEAQTIAMSEWERLSHMSLDELEANRNTFKTPYSAGTGSQFTISVNLGEKGTFNNGTCGAVSGGYANCFKNTTVTVYRDGNRMFTTRTLPLMAGNYTRKEIDNLLASMKNDYINRDNTIKNDYTTKINNLSNNMANNYLNKNSKAYVRNLNESQLAAVKFDSESNSIHGFIDGTDKPFNTEIKEMTFGAVELGWNFTYKLPANGILFMMAHNEIRDFKVNGVKPAWFTDLMKCGHDSGFVYAGKKGETITFLSEPDAHPLMYYPMQ